MSGVRGAHHVLRVEALLGQLGHRQSTVRLRPAGRKRRKPDHEKVQPGERHHVHGQLAEVAVQLSGKPERARGSADGGGYEVVEVAIRRGGELEGAEADVVEGLVVEGEALVGVLDQLVHGEGGVVRLDDGVGHLGRRDHRVRRHDPVRVLLAHLKEDDKSAINKKYSESARWAKVREGSGYQAGAKVCGPKF